MSQRKKRSVSRLSSSLTGKIGFRSQGIAIRQVREWMKTIPEGDSMYLRCESALPDKQFKIWKKWFIKHEDLNWEISDEEKSFFFYRSHE